MTRNQVHLWQPITSWLLVGWKDSPDWLLAPQTESLCLLHSGPAAATAWRPRPRRHSPGLCVFGSLPGGGGAPGSRLCTRHPPPGRAFPVDAAPEHPVHTAQETPADASQLHSHWPLGMRWRVMEKSDWEELVVSTICSFSVWVSYISQSCMTTWMHCWSLTW